MSFSPRLLCSFFLAVLTRKNKKKREREREGGKKRELIIFIIAQNFILFSLGR